jgi:hypothetical protein
MPMSPVKIASFILQLLLLFVQVYLPPVQPEGLQKAIMFVFGGIALFFTFIGIPLYPAGGPVGPLVVAVGLVAFALVPPFAGLLESKFGPNGQAIYSTGVLPGTANRFPGHLLTNILGALASSACLWVAHSTNGFDKFVARFPHDAAFNIMLPLSMITVFSFARWQQADACPDIDEIVKHSGWEVKITGFSLRHWHQLTNVLYLIAVAFTATTTFVYLVAYVMEQAKAGQPLEVSWQIILVILVSLSFLYACGGPWSRQYRAVYLTFLTGTPAALGSVIFLLSWFRDDVIRNIAVMSIVGIGYVLYCVEAVLASRAQGEMLHLNYFSAAGIAVVLAVLLGALYLS